MKIRSKMVLLSVLPLALTVLIISVVATISINDSMEGVIENDLRALAANQKTSISLVQGNMYSVDENGTLWNRNSLNITGDVNEVDKIRDESNIQTSVYYGDTCYMTTIKDADGKRVLGVKVTEDVIETVINSGEDYFSQNVEIAGEKYFGYFSPIYNAGGIKAVGMVFVGMSRADVEASIVSILVKIIGVAVVGIVASVVAILVVATKMSKRIKYGVSTLGQVAGGNLVVDVDSKVAKSKDEIGDIIRAIVSLKEKLVGVVGNIFEKSSDVNDCSNKLGDATAETTIAVEQVERAVAELADGAGAQAEDTQKATENVLMMGELIEETTGNVARLNENADSMEQQGEIAADILKELDQINLKAKESIDVIYHQTNITNESVKKISAAVNIISSISEETNLLSLNASIEAARAGEQGKGFAVVATQIQKLAEQSNNSAMQIEAIVESLISDSQKEVEIMEEVKEIMLQQSDMVEKTNHVVKDVIEGITVSRNEIKTIADIARELDASRTLVVDLVQNLSAIAEQNAATSEETSASATEVNATIQEMAENAAYLRSIAEELERSINVFKIR